MDEYENENTEYDQYEDDTNQGSQQHYIQRRRKTPDDLAGAASGGGGECCAHVVSPLVFLATLAGLAIATFFLRMAITMNLRRKRRRRSVMKSSKSLMYILTGMGKCRVSMCLLRIHLDQPCLHQFI